MRISDRYITRQVLLGTFSAVAVLGVVLLMGNLFKRIHPLLVEQGAPLGVVVRFVLNVLPMSLMYTVPWGFLSAVLLVFGRMSVHEEITAFRAAGVSLPRLAAPVFAIGVLLSLGSLWLNTELVPRSKATVSQLLYEQASRDPDSLLKPGVVQGDFDGSGGRSQKVLIEAKAGDWVEGFHFHQIPTDGSSAGTYVHARRAALRVLEEQSQLRIKLEDAYFEVRKPDGTVDIAFAGTAEPLLIDLKNPKHRRKRPSGMTRGELLEALQADPQMPQPSKVRLSSEITKRVSFSFACLAFAFVAVPLGIGSRRRDNSAGLVLSLVIGTGYFLVTVLSEHFETELGAKLVLWAPNIACVIIGIVLFRRSRFR
ncbi:MAG: YjgP/YjgQ family permease [Verrucomicrobia bacterium]|nr:YjgP/YjgQ family permease [Verrucomicrobiota bacterium]